MVDPATLAAELTRLRSSSSNPVRQAVADLYLHGLIYPVGVRDGQVIWKGVAQEAAANG
jgi:hypothetical protein